MDKVILLDEALQECGVMDKSKVHQEKTPLHMAFSCYVMNSNNELLITRRSLDKKAWPGVWTNSFCGHPLPHEQWSDAVKRRGAFELNMEISEPILLDENFRYCATDKNGIQENEYCPIFIALENASPQPNSDEVIDFAWVSAPKLIMVTDMLPEIFSPWMIQQLKIEKIRSVLTKNT